MAQSELFRELQDVSREPAGDTDVGEQGERPVLRDRLQAVVIIPAAVFVLAGVVIAMALVSATSGKFEATHLIGIVAGLGAAFLAVRGKRFRQLNLCLAALVLLGTWAVVFAVVL